VGGQRLQGVSAGFCPAHDGSYYAAPCDELRSLTAGNVELALGKLREITLPIKTAVKRDLPSMALDPGIQAGMMASVDYFQ
jgi:hypothetical protein